MAQALGNSQLPRWLLLQAGGSLQHARTLLSGISSSGLGVTSSSSSSSFNSSNAGACVSHDAGRSICTTRGIYMGRVFIRENLQRQPPQHPLFNRDNYQFLEKNAWSMSACEQVLHNHQESQGYRHVPLVQRQLAANIEATGDLLQLHALVTRHAHQLNSYNCVRAVQRTAWLLTQSNGVPDYQAAALVLNTIAAHMQPKLADFSGPALCQVLASYVKCRCSPPADMLQEMLQILMADGGAKLHETNATSLSQLLLALSRLVQPQGHWPIMQAVLQHATTLLQAQISADQRRQEQLQNNPQQQPGAGADSSSSSIGGADNGTGGQQELTSRRGRKNKYEPVKVSSDGAGRSKAAERAHQQAAAMNHARGTVTAVNSMALTAVLLDKANTFSPEYLRLLYQWLEDRSRLACLYPNAAVQLWLALKGQWAKFEARTSANAGAAVAAATGSASDKGQASSSSSSGDAAPASTAAAAGAAGLESDSEADAAPRQAAPGSIAEHQQKLFGFYGQEALQSLADATVPLVTSMTENHLGQLFNCVGRMRYTTPDLLAALTGAFTALSAVKAPTNHTKANVAWAAAQLQQYDPALLLPALLAAVQHPEQQDGFLSARIMIATSQLPPQVLQQMQLLLRQEQHRLSGARGPAPTAAAAVAAAGAGGASVDPATAAAGQVPDWVTSLADSLAGRIAEVRPREIAYILLSYSQIPGVPIHERLFTAAAEHIVVHAHTFTQLDDMEMVATAFEKFNFKAGLPALKALQQQAEQMASPSAAA